MSKLTLEDAISHCLEVAEQNETQADKWQEEGGEQWGKTTACRECAADHRQLAEWLTELKELREQIQKAKSMLLDSSYTVEVMCNKISGTIGCEKCTYYNPETQECEVRAFIFKTRAFVKEGENDA
jgi:hypothetical protein